MAPILSQHGHMERGKKSYLLPAGLYQKKKKNNGKENMWTLQNVKTSGLNWNDWNMQT